HASNSHATPQNGIPKSDSFDPINPLDIACGDASATVNALKGLRLAQYCGIDLSQPALDLAGKALDTLGCPYDLKQCDFVTELRSWSDPIDVAWIGISLHHLRAPAKLALMAEIRRIVGDTGLFLIYEPASPDSEDRDAWLNRWEHDNRLSWTALSTDEWDAMMTHVRAADFPETTSQWQSLGREAGFSRVREVFVAPTDLFRMYCFQA
ncbi:class I SAM-dependent methyltransferase, partial [Mesorhizobium sp.]|uniref:class I SAM-dependent methyltransferase n=1 Tax=Mesorhizobium sp. TaxID=1871066 RepID=UPI001205D518